MNAHVDTFSPDLMADLTAWHARLAAGGDRPADARQVLARCIAALADNRRNVATVLDAAVELLAQGQTEAARMMLASTADHFRGELAN